MTAEEQPGHGKSILAYPGEYTRQHHRSISDCVHEALTRHVGGFDTTLQLVSTNKQTPALVVNMTLFLEMWYKPDANIRHVIAFGFNMMHFRIQHDDFGIAVIWLIHGRLESRFRHSLCAYIGVVQKHHRTSCDVVGNNCHVAIL